MHVKRPIWMALVGVAVAVLAPPVLGWVAARFVPPARPDNIAQPPGYEALDRYLEQQLGRLNVPGAAVAVVDGDQIVHERGFGQGRRGGPPPSPQTPFVLGSTTKSFTALAVMQLVEAGKINLDAPVQHYLPWVPCRRPAGVGSNHGAPVAQSNQRLAHCVRMAAPRQ
ncbi:MAG TPA: serine hydrolase domain-containing protein [Propionibacteriaceae bacterium]